MALSLFAAVVALGLLVRLIMLASQWRQLRRTNLPREGHWCGVSILKPVKGVDPGLEENLRSVFQQDYPCFEVLVGAQDPNDPALAIARRVAAQFPHIRCVVVADNRQVGPNPKVANLANLLPHAQHEVVLISDSNVRLAPETLKDMVAKLQEPGVGLVSSPIRGTLPGSMGGAVDAFLLNTFVMGGTAAMHRLLGGVCVVGKSMMLRRSTLQALGGLEFLAQFLAEDQVCGEAVAAQGLKVELAPLPVHNVTGSPSLGQVAGRYLRWAKIRRRMAPAGFVGEPLLFPFAMASLGLLLAPSWAAVALWGLTLALQGGLAWTSFAVVGERWPLKRMAASLMVAEFVAVGAWLMAWFSRTVQWRGQCFLIGPRTQLQPITAEAELDPVVPLAQPAPHCEVLPASTAS
ncbi:MAG: glycosyltransferase [Thermoanaerobaculum sp.]|nr:glycosyltransferase [Thermoanaerobaculum sp.]